MPVIRGFYYSLFEGDRSHTPPVVLIHGAGSHHLCWPAGLRRLAGWHVLAVDLPGHGRSQGVGAQTIEAYAAQVRQFLDDLEIHRAILVGHSMGGAIALQMALDYPTLAAGLGMIASGAYLGVPPDLLEAMGNPVTFPVGLNILHERAFSPAASSALVQRSLAMLQEARPSVVRGDWLACASFDVRTALLAGREGAAAIQTPAWVACGEDDQLTPPAFARFLVSAIPGAVLQVIPGAGHMVIVEQPEALVDSLRQFLERGIQG